MYVLKRSYVFDPYYGEWEQKDLKLFKINEIMAFSDFKLILALASDPDTEWAFMKSQMGEYHTDFTGRFGVGIWLSTFTEDTLPRSDRPVLLSEVNYVEYRELFRSGAKLKNVRIKGRDLTLIPRRTENQKYGINYFKDNCLLVINRRVFQIEEYLESLYIYHAGERLQEVPGEHSVGFIDFSRLNGIGATRVTENQVTDISNENDKKNNNIRFRVVLEEPITGKTPFIVINGHMHLLDGTIFQADAKTFVITIDAEKLVERILEDKKLYEKLEYVYNANIRGGGIRIDTLDITKLMANEWSFFGWINHNELLARREVISRSNTETMFQHYRVPKGLCYFEDGELAQPRIFNYNQYLCSLIVNRSRGRWHGHDTVKWEETKAKAKSGYNDKKPIERNIYIKDIYYF